LYAAVIVTGVVVTATPVARPLTVIVTLDVLDDVQVTIFVMSCGLPTLKVPVAVYCCWTKSGIVDTEGVTAMLVSVPLVTVSVVLPDIVP
jgi:hypothetical protein